MAEIPSPGLYEALLTGRLQRLLDRLPEDRLVSSLGDLLNAESSDRVSRHLARLIALAIDAVPERDRAAEAIRLASALLTQLQSLANPDLHLEAELPVDPAQVLHAVSRLQPDGTPNIVDRPLTPLLDTTILTNAPGEPAVGHELRAEIPSADSVDIVIAFIRFSGIQPLLDGSGDTAKRVNGCGFSPRPTPTAPSSERSTS